MIGPEAHDAQNASLRGIGAERGLASCLMRVDPVTVDWVLDHLALGTESVPLLNDPTSSLIIDAISALHSRSQPTDREAVLAELGRGPINGRYFPSTADAESCLDHLIDAVPDPTHVRCYLIEVRLAQFRQMPPEMAMSITLAYEDEDVLAAYGLTRVHAPSPAGGASA